MKKRSVLHSRRLLFASLAAPEIIETALATRIRNFPAECAKGGTVALTAVEFDFQEDGGRTEFLLFYSRPPQEKAAAIVEKLNVSAALRPGDIHLPGGSRVRFRRLRFELEECSRRGILLRGYAVIDLDESAFAAADRPVEAPLFDFPGIEQDIAGRFREQTRLTLSQARIEPESEVNFRFSSPQRKNLLSLSYAMTRP